MQEEKKELRLHDALIQVRRMSEMNITQRVVIVINRRSSVSFISLSFETFLLSLFVA